MLEVTEIKALVIYLFTYETFKKRYKKGLWQLRVFFVLFYWCYLFLTIIKYSLSTKKIISKSWLEKRHYQHKRFYFFYWIPCSVTK